MGLDGLDFGAAVEANGDRDPGAQLAVDGDAAARLSVETVRQTAGGKGTAEALRRAELALMKDRSIPGAAHPAIWAPFVVVEN